MWAVATQPGAWGGVREAGSARPKLGDLHPPARAGTHSTKEPRAPGHPWARQAWAGSPAPLGSNPQPTEGWALGDKPMLLSPGPPGAPRKWRVGVRVRASPGAQAGMESGQQTWVSGMGQIAGIPPRQGLRVCSRGGPMRTITPGLTALFFGSPGRHPTPRLSCLSLLSGTWGLMAWGLKRHCCQWSPLLVPSWELPWPKSLGHLGWIPAWISAGDWAKDERDGQTRLAPPPTGPATRLLWRSVCGPGG